MKLRSIAIQGSNCNRIDDGFIRSGLKQFCNVLHRRNPSVERNWNKNIPHGRADDLGQTVQVIKVRNRIHTDQFISALFIVLVCKQTWTAITLSPSK
jgi:hypothetical protein